VLPSEHMLLTGVINDLASISSDTVTIRLTKCLVSVIAGRWAVSTCPQARQSLVSPRYGQPLPVGGARRIRYRHVCIVIFWISQ
jgi:hypothetical protein